MNLLDEQSQGFSQEGRLAGASLLLAAPTRRPIDPFRALAILKAEAAAATAGGLRAATNAPTQELGEAVGIR